MDGCERGRFWGTGLGVVNSVWDGYGGWGGEACR